MHYYKKSCVLRQLKQGFSGDGKPLTGLIKVEKYGQNLAVEVSIVNFAPLTSGEYYCLLSDGYGQVEKLPLRGKCYFNLLSDLRLDEGFCGVVCFVHEEITPIACGINGERHYEFSKILSAAFPPQKEQKRGVPAPEKTKNEPTREEFNQILEEATQGRNSVESAYDTCYDDELLSQENYYETEGKYESDLPQKSSENVPLESGDQDEEAATRTDASTDADDADVRHPFAVDGRGYYDAVQDEIRTLFATHPHDDTLKGAFSCSEWVRVKGEEGAPLYLVGVVYEEFLPKFICYAVAAEDEKSPPEEFGSACVFVPVSALAQDKGFFVIFQSAATGECIKPTRA